MVNKKQDLYYDVTEKKLRDTIESIINKRTDKGRGKDFQFTCYCSVEQYRSVTTGADQFHMAIMKDAGYSDNEVDVWKKEEFKRRNNG